MTASNAAKPTQLTNETTRDLCLALMHADTQDAVIQILTDAGVLGESQRLAVLR